MTTPVPAVLFVAAVVIPPVDVEPAALLVAEALALSFFLSALSSVPVMRPAADPAEPAFAAFIASTSPGGRGMLYFLYALTSALVPAPGLRPVN